MNRVVYAGPQYGVIMGIQLVTDPHLFAVKPRANNRLCLSTGVDDAVALMFCPEYTGYMELHILYTVVVADYYSVLHVL